MTMMTTTTNGNRLVASCDRYYRVAHRVVFVRAAPARRSRRRELLVNGSRLAGLDVDGGRAAGVDGALLVPISQREHEERLVRDEAEREHARRAIDALVESTLAARPDLDPNLARREVVRRCAATRPRSAPIALIASSNAVFPTCEGLAVVDALRFGYPDARARRAQGLAGRLEETIQKIAGTRDDRRPSSTSNGASPPRSTPGAGARPSPIPGRHALVLSPGGRYRKHRDNTRVDAKTTSNARALTAIFYATDHDWDDHFDGGHLRFYFGDDDDDDDKSRRRQNVVVDVRRGPPVRFV
ncbi:hypothetical protein CTAYLR_010254 [Chrysophaeum taylorii]|uniref:Prolyl 4-hydroxylase alpha subunit Fe(2+) 2OG dioxygenase domain-containing protein n=1 Tax=Chrysophaeum taylorii TaxID=2483200 RepID=A0AAD7XP68_9STRA|nr:hypothetical protein CTAYLR_010254 [Chrysophaeum taylorii]